jgi:ribonuclease Z
VSLRVIFLGTAAGVPTRKRSLPAILLQREGEQLMFDCGEGVQRQMLMAKTSLNKITKVFISHMHGDHVMGLPGLLQTMALLGRERRLDIYGPPKLREFLHGISETVQFVLTFQVEIHEIKRAGIICQGKEYAVHAVRSKHVITSFAYAYVEKSRSGTFYPERAKALDVSEGPLWSKLQKGEEIKLPNGKIVKPEDVMGPPRLGRKIVYTGDTRPFKRLEEFAEGADMLIHDSTLGDELAARAEEYGHSTVDQAAESAKEAKVKQLVLTHISQRYEDTSKWLEQARKIFKNTIVAEDFATIEIPLLEK